MSPNAQEKMYKDGMRKDEDGFTDITWCVSKVLHTWDDFRKEFMKANERKAISPTQFNHQSTRGHCIMTLEVEKPMDDDPSRKQRGRLYVCDLAGTEPAGDVFYAQYKVEEEDGEKEYKLIGPHPDQTKTKELQDQGKKINLSLSEMAQFFMKMAEAITKKTLKPGGTIPGCNTYFLCKYLKDTLLQAKTYLFCAVRPEVTYHKYTFATLGFAKNASVIKLQPKKAASGAITAGERKLMAELDALKAQMDEMQLKNKELAASGGGGAAGGEDVEGLVAAKLAELQKLQENSANAGESDDQLREKYARNGMALTRLDGKTDLPHFTNIDRDSFRDGVFMYIISKPEMKFGPKDDFRPSSLAVLQDHCTVLLDSGKVSVMAGQGRTFVNGQMLKKDETRELQAFDRLAVESELLLLRIPGQEPSDDPPSVEQAVDEYQMALVAAAGGGGGDLADLSREKSGMKEEDALRIDALLAETHPKLDQVKEMCAMIDPSVPLEFILTLKRSKLTSKSKGSDVDVGVTVNNTSSSQSIVLSVQDFNQIYSVLSDDLSHMRDAVQYGGEHVLPTENRPVVRFFDRMIHSGTCVQFPEFFLYNMESDPEDAKAKVYTMTAGSKIEGGDLEVSWTPMAGPDDDGSGQIDEIDDPKDWLGKPFTYRCVIKAASGFPTLAAATYIEYNFFGERVITEAKEYEKGTRSPNYEHFFVHHIPSVTAEFVEFMKQPLELQIYTTPYVFVPPAGISTNDPGVAARIVKDAGACISPSFASHSMLKKSLFENVGAEPEGEQETDSLRRELSKVKNEKRRMQVKQVVSELGHVAGAAGKAAARMTIDSTVEELRSRVVELEKQLVERGPVPPAGPPSGNPRNSGSAQSARIEELEKRCEKLAQQIRDLGHVPLD
jgi:hypothetical protein